VFTFYTGFELQNPGIGILVIWFLVAIASLSGFLTFDSGSDNLGSKLEQYGIFIIYSFFAIGYMFNAWRRASQ
jgi:hypothetical protein